jgi:hypothetical protein
MWTARGARTLLIVLALAGLAVRADEPRKPPPAEEPDPGFLEFLGSVDRMAEVNPDYLSQAGPPTARVPGIKPPPPPPPPKPPPPPNAAGDKNND